MSDTVIVGILALVGTCAGMIPAFFQIRKGRTENTTQHGDTGERLTSLENTVTKQGLAMLDLMQEYHKEFRAHANDRSIHL